MTTDNKSNDKITVDRLTTGLLGVNTYIVGNEKTHECVLIDTGGDYRKIKDTLFALNYTPRAVLLTHGHFDHIGACESFQKDGLKIYIAFPDDGFTTNPRLDGFPDVSKLTKAFKCDEYVFDGETLDIAGLKIEVIATPGHSKGSVCYLIGDFLFTGDTLFHMSIGRTDFEGGDFDELISSVKNKLFVLTDKKVFPGHGEFTDIDFEKANNPYFR